MPLTFPTSPTNGQTTTLSGTTYTYNATKGVWEATASGGGFVAGSFSENILPATDDTYDIGSAEKKIRDLYVSDNSLHIGDHTMSADSEGINIPALKLGTGSNRVKLMANAEGKLRQVRTVSGVAQAEEGISSDAGTTAVDTFAELQAAPVVAGKTVLVRNTNKLYINTGTGWYVVGQVTNESPTAITGLDATYSLASDGTATVITMNSTDPEGFPLTWSHAVTTGTLGSTATITNVDNVFTITPSTTEADAGSFSVTFSASDGNQASTSVSAFTLSFVYATQTQKIQNSSYNLNGNMDWDDDGNTLIIGTDEDRALIWHRTGDVWTQAVALAPQSGDENDSFGMVYSGLSMSGDGMTAVVGAMSADVGDASAGGFYVYKRTGNTWAFQTKLYNPIPQNSAWHGRNTQLSRDGNVLIVNSQNHNGSGGSGNWNYGKSFLYTRSGNTWSLIQTLTPHGSSHQYFQFGKFQALSGDGKHAVFCNWGDGWPSTQDGSLSFWKRTTGAFTNLISRTKATAWTAGDHYGERLALDYLGETCVVGTPQYDSGKGNVHVWTRSGNSWSQQQDISNPLSTGSFGSDVDITSDGNMIIIGASGSNKIYIYERSGSTWTETASFDADDTTSGDQLGKFVQVSDNKDKFIASSPGQTDGATYYFKKV